jgi:hypothetical protein
MKKLVLGAMLVVAGSVVCQDAEANQGFFGGRPMLDASINMRRSTAEQFDPIRGQSVAQRPRPDFDPVPIEVSSFQLFPALSVASYYDSNIYATQSNSHNDFVWKIDPTLAVVSNWGRHALAFTGVADLNAYTTHDEENYNGGAMQAEGRYDISEQTWLQGVLGYQRVTEPRSSPSVIGAAAGPSQYNLMTAGGEAYRGVGDLKIKLNYDFSHYDYDDVDLTGGGVADQTTRDRNYNKFSGDFSYTVTENFKPFVRANYEFRDYVTSGSRSSEGFQADTGATMDLGGIVTGEAYIGYISRDYQNFASGQVNLFDFGGRALWNVTELTSVEAEVARSVEETTLGGSAAIVDTGGSVTVTHELRRNIILEGNAAYSIYDFEDSTRQDNVYDVGVGARYFLNRNFYADATYDYNLRDSNVAGSDYGRHVVLLRVGSQY